MKKIYLLCASCLAVLSASAYEPAVYKDAQLYGVSHNGLYLAGYCNESTTIVNRATGTVTLIDGEDAFVPGNIAPLSDLGVLVGTTSYYDGHAAYMINGEIFLLDSPNPDMSSHANSISADGKVIVGSVGTAVMSTNENDEPMQLPALWELQEDGGYGKVVILPHPDKDFSGRVPQYITALVVNDNGTIVMGQVRDYSGAVIQNIKYTRDDNGNWSYAMLDDDLINPNHYEFPEWPGDGPSQPSEESFMTEEEVTACEEAQTEWYNNAMDTGDWSAEYPQYTSYMTEEELAAYNAALAAYQEELEAWSAKYYAFTEVFYNILENAPSFDFNNMAMSGNGKYAVTTSAVAVESNDGGDFLDGGFGNYVEYNAPVLINVESGEMTFYPHEYNLHVTCILDDGTMLGAVTDDTYGTYLDAYAWELGAAAPVDYVNYLSTLNSSSATWVKENCIHDVSGYEQDDNGNWVEVSIPNVRILGLPMASTDKTTFVNYCAVLWDDEDGSDVNSYVYDGFSESGVNNAAVSAFTVKALKGGKVYVSGDVKNITVVDLNGRVIFNGNTPNGVLDFGISNGAYIIKATATDGSSKVVKAVF